MSATPIIPGQAYSVRYEGRAHRVIASNGAHAICVLLEALGL